MKRFVSLVTLALILGGCAMLREGNPATTPPTGKGTDYPCGYHGQQCLDTKPPTCCTAGVCANDGEPFCDNRPPSDPSEPVNWSARMPARLPRSSAQ